MFSTAAAAHEARALTPVATARPGASTASAVAFSGVVMLVLLSPFEMTEPLLRLPGQSISSVETVLLLMFGAWAVSIVGCPHAAHDRHATHSTVAGVACGNGGGGGRGAGSPFQRAAHGRAARAGVRHLPRRAEWRHDQLSCARSAAGHGDRRMRGGGAGPHGFLRTSRRPWHSSTCSVPRPPRLARRSGRADRFSTRPSRRCFSKIAFACAVGLLLLCD